MARARKKTKRKTKPKYTARTADKHVLYQIAVQDPETEIHFVSRVFKKKHARPPLKLREDFCGTAHMCAHWVKSNPQRTAVGVDLDRGVLAWGKRHNLAPINEPGQRVRLLQQDVCNTVRGPFGAFDVALAFNFSYWIFKTRADLLRYFSSVYRSLGKGGMFFLDCFGGYNAQDKTIEPRRVGGFTYVWEQHAFNPITHRGMNYIHFRFRDGSKMKRAFTYDWRHWTMPEIRELLAEAGFRQSTVYWEGPGDDGHGDGIFRPTESVENEAAWVAYVVAER
ncbi:MAG TPA: class I SAM-dependent methyltransferase [Polyangiaceae bacterium]|nr:class I SAM-dependent methyltransferase [Polyangiaceae bacterium]